MSMKCEQINEIKLREIIKNSIEKIKQNKKMPFEIFYENLLKDLNEIQDQINFIKNYSQKLLKYSQQNNEINERYKIICQYHEEICDKLDKLENLSLELNDKYGIDI